MWAWLPLLAGFPLIMEETVRGNGHSQERMGDEMGEGQKRVGPGAVAPEAQLHAVSSHSFRSQYTLLLSKIVCMHIHPLRPHRSQLVRLGYGTRSDQGVAALKVMVDIY